MVLLGDVFLRLGLFLHSFGCVYSGCSSRSPHICSWMCIGRGLLFALAVGIAVWPDGAAFVLVPFYFASMRHRFLECLVWALCFECVLGPGYVVPDWMHVIAVCFL